MAQVMAGRYELLSTLGTGGMGTVFLAEDRQTGQKVALKRLNTEILLHDASLLERFRREADILRQLNHPGMVHVFDTFDEADAHYIVMEFISGGSLRQRLDKEHCLPLHQALLLALDLADALTRAHRLEIVHRDLKPANVLIAEDGTPRLTDFGVARMGNRERVTGTGAVIGTLDYLSPEALNGEVVDARTDVWSFGVMLYEMLAGERPFKGDSVGQTITAILTQPVPRLETALPGCPMALVDLIERMLEKDPALRLPGMRVAGAELEALLGSKPGTSSGRPVAASVAETGRFETPTPDSGDIPNNIPAQMTPFIGREQELAELIVLLDNPTNRLITLTAPGGMGKTSLAFEAARRIVRAEAGWQNKLFQQGVFAASLAPLNAVEHIISAIAGALGLQFGGSTPREQLLDYCRMKHLLLVLDNFEHLLSGAAIITDILQAAPGVKILVTSRERLNLDAETLVHLSGMDFPDWETPEDALHYSAVKLFTQSARRVRPDFELTADNLRYVARICRLTGGMPLGILLAAAWVEVLSPAEIASEISRSIDFLESELRDLPERHRSMRATFEYSWKLLDEVTRQSFQKLSIFRGGFTREAAQAVTGIGLRGLTALVNKSLLQRNIQSGRFDVHELVRQYGEERLNESGEADQTRQAHAAYFAEFLSRRWEDVKGRRQVEVFREITPEFENIRAGWQHQPWETGSETLMNMVKSLWWYSDLHNHGHDAFELLELTLAYPALSGDDPAVIELRELVRAVFAWFHAGEGRPDGKALAQQAIAGLETHRYPENLLVAWIALWLVMTAIDEMELSSQSAHRIRDLAEQSGNAWGLAVGSYGYLIATYFAGMNSEETAGISRGTRPMGLAESDDAQFDEALTLEARTLSVLEAANDHWTLGYYHSFLAHFAKAPELARHYLERALFYFQAIEHLVGIGRVFHPLATLNMQQGNYKDAVRYYRQALKAYSRSGQTVNVLDPLNDCAILLRITGKYETAVELSTLVEQDRRTLATTHPQCAENLAALKTLLPPDNYAAAVERGKHLTLDEAVTRLVENEDW